MKKKILGFVIFLLVLNIKVYSDNNIFLTYKIENQILTNVDIKNESVYLLALSSQLKNLDDKTILKIAEGSLVRETVKKIELLKYMYLKKDNKMLDVVIRDFYVKLNLNNEQEFKKYLNNYDLTLNEVKEKINIETSWNRLIYDKYNNQVQINIKDLKKKIKIKKKSEYSKSYRLSEIVFEKKNITLNDTFKIIENSIKEIGFKNSANIYSIASSAKFGGDLSWVQEKNLSKKILITLEDLTIGKHTQPIQIGNKFLILNLDEVKEEKIKIDEKKELEKMITYERNRQLKQFSKIYYDKVKINTIINEL